jgi:hypothetical protein
MVFLFEYFLSDQLEFNNTENKKTIEYSIDQLFFCKNGDGDEIGIGNLRCNLYNIGFATHLSA